MALPATESAADDAGPPPRRRRTWLSVLFFSIGLLMLGAALWTLSRHADTLDQARAAARDASPWLIVATLLLPIANWLATAASIWVLVGRYGRVRPGEMAALIGAAWLLNMLPMRPGMVGRLAYHKKINGIRVRDSVRAMIAALICTACALGTLLGMVALAAWERGPLGIILLAAGPPAALLGATLAVRARGRPHLWRWPAAIGFRYVDMLTWAVRYTLVFTLIGHPVGLVGGAAMTSVGQVAMMTPVQLGLREWAVGAASAALEVSEEPARPLDPQRLAHATAPGLLADCVMRAAELLFVIPVGLCASAWIVRRLRAHAAGAGVTAPPDGAPSPAPSGR